jgi:DNA gyrase/topoisomerase IV subunit B
MSEPKDYIAAADIQIISTIRDAVRKRPAMYVGDVNDKDLPNHILCGLLEPSIREAIQSGEPRRICIDLFPGAYATFSDDGPGRDLTVPDEYQQYEALRGKTYAELYLTSIWSHPLSLMGPSPEEKPLFPAGKGYWPDRAACDVVTANALSRHLLLETFNNGLSGVGDYLEGVEAWPFTVEPYTGPRKGTQVTFRVDSRIVPDPEFDPYRLGEMIQKVKPTNLEVLIRTTRAGEEPFILNVDD